MAPNGSQRLPTAPYDNKHALLLFSSSMTPNDFHLLPPRELTPQPYSQALASSRQALTAADSLDGADPAANSKASLLGVKVSRHTEVNI